MNGVFHADTSRVEVDLDAKPQKGTIMSFNNKVALVTGAGSGIGEAIAKELARLGASVVVADINEAGAQRVANEIAAAGGTASPIVADSASPDDNERAVAFALSTYGKLNYAVNNAGIGGNAAPTGEIDLEDWDRVIAINLNGILYAMRYQIPAMLEAGAKSARSSIWHPFMARSPRSATAHIRQQTWCRRSDEECSSGIRSAGLAYQLRDLLTSTRRFWIICPTRSVRSW